MWGAAIILKAPPLLFLNHSADIAITMVEPGTDRSLMREDLQFASIEK